MASQPTLHSFFTLILIWQASYLHFLAISTVVIDWGKLPSLLSPQTILLQNAHFMLRTLQKYTAKSRHHRIVAVHVSFLHFFFFKKVSWSVKGNASLPALSATGNKELQTTEWAFLSKATALQSSYAAALRPRTGTLMKTATQHFPFPLLLHQFMSFSKASTSHPTCYSYTTG